MAPEQSPLQTFRFGISHLSPLEQVGRDFALHAEMQIENLAIADFLTLMQEHQLAVGFRVLARTSGDPVLFEHRASVRQAADALRLTIAIPMELMPPGDDTRLLYIDCVYERRFWFHDVGPSGIYLSVGRSEYYRAVEDLLYIIGDKALEA